MPDVAPLQTANRTIWVRMTCGVNIGHGNTQIKQAHSCGMGFAVSKLMRCCLSLIGFVLTVAVSAGVRAEFESSLALTSGPGGGLEVAVTIGGQQAGFLLDTGAAMVTINSALFARLKAAGGMVRAREVAGRMADGRVKRLEVYEIQSLQLGIACQLEAIEVVVVPGTGKNLLGLNALARFAPLTLRLSPPSLSLSQCFGPAVAAADLALNEPAVVQPRASVALRDARAR